ncbi:MAG: SGNH/GDSL hydrolase family protein [Geodermatophilaceae bacterium]
MVLRSARGQIRLLAALFAGLLVGGLGAPASAAPGTPSAPAVQPLITWAASADVTFTKVTQQTVRNVVTTSVAGRGLQVSLSNAFGSAPVTFRTISVGVVQSGATLVPGSSRQVFFGGDPSITVPVGEEVLSDPLPGNVAARQTLAVSVYVDAEVRRATGHNLAVTANYLSEPGDHASEDSGSAYTRGLSRWIFLESLVVTQRAAQSTVAALGDSITDGVGSTPGTNRRWTDYLAQRLIAAPPNAEKGVANEGISANRGCCPVASDRAPCGDSAGTCSPRRGWRR